MTKFKRIKKGEEAIEEKSIDWKQILTVIGAVILILAFILPMIVQSF